MVAPKAPDAPKSAPKRGTSNVIQLVKPSRDRGQETDCPTLADIQSRIDRGDFIGCYAICIRPDQTTVMHPIGNTPAARALMDLWNSPPFGRGA